MYAAVMTVLLAVGASCPACQGQTGAAVAPNGNYRQAVRPLVYQHRLWCRPGQQCLSCTQPIAPGYGTYNYRTLFNYPWSMGPELVGYPGYGYPIPQAEELPPVECRSAHRASQEIADLAKTASGTAS